MTTPRHQTAEDIGNTPDTDADVAVARIDAAYRQLDALAAQESVPPALTALTPTGERLLDELRFLLRNRRHQSAVEAHLQACIKETAALISIKDGAPT